MENITSPTKDLMSVGKCISDLFVDIKNHLGNDEIMFYNKKSWDFEANIMVSFFRLKVFYGDDRPEYFKYIDPNKPRNDNNKNNWEGINAESCQ